MPKSEFFIGLQSISSEILPNNPGNNAISNAPFRVNLGKNKTDLIPFSGGAGIVTGFRNCIDAVGQLNVQSAVPDVGNNSGILGLEPAVVQLLKHICVGDAANVCTNPEVFQVIPILHILKNIADIYSFKFRLPFAGWGLRGVLQW